jgi:hypothetical protein
MEEERDIVVFTDDDGNEIEMDVVDYFDYEGQEYAVLMDLGAEGEACACDDEECECCSDQDVYIMKIVTNGDMEEFLPVDDDIMDKLIPIVEERLFGDDEEEE